MMGGEYKPDERAQQHICLTRFAVQYDALRPISEYGRGDVAVVLSQEHAEQTFALLERLKEQSREVAQSTPAGAVPDEWRLVPVFDEEGKRIAMRIVSDVQPSAAQSGPYVAVPEELFSELYNHLDNIADFDPSYPPDTEPRNTSAELLLELKALCDGKQMEGK